MILKSHLIRFFVPNSDELEDFLIKRNIPIHYKFSSEEIPLFLIFQLSNNIFVIFKNRNNEIKHIIININPTFNPRYIQDTNVYQNYNNSSNTQSFSNINKIFGIDLLKLKNYKPNIQFQESLNNILSEYDTKYDLEIITNAQFFRDGNKSSISTILTKYYISDKIPFSDFSNLINTSPFLFDPITFRDIRYEDININNLNTLYIINNDYRDSHIQQIDYSNTISYVEIPHINVLGLNDPIFFEYTNQFFRKYFLILNNYEFINRLIDYTSIDSNTQDSIKRTFIINNNVFTYSTNFSGINLVKVDQTSNNEFINYIKENIDIDKIYEIQNKSKTNILDTIIIDKEYLFKKSLKYVQDNIPGLNFYSSLVDPGPSDHINKIKLIDFTDNFAYERFKNYIFIPRLIFHDIDTNQYLTYYNIFVKSDSILFTQQFDRYDNITIENPFNNNRIIINRQITNNIIDLLNVDLSISLYDDITSFDVYSNNIHGNLLYYIEKNINNYYTDYINLNLFRFNNILSIKINKSLIDILQNAKISGLAIDRNVNLNNSLNILNNINSRFDSRFSTEVPNLIRSLVNQNNLYRFPLPIILFRNIQVNAPILTKSSIDIISNNFDMTKFYNSIIDGTININDICNEIIDILKIHAPDNTTDINSIINYKTISGSIISNIGNTNNIALIFNLLLENSNIIIPFILQLGRGNIFIPEASINIRHSNTNINYPTQGLTNILTNNAERTIFITDYSSLVYTSNISSSPSFRFVTTRNNIIPIKHIEFFNINNINSTINRIIINTYKVTDIDNKITIPIRYDITNINEIYDQTTRKYIKYFDDIITDQIDVTINLSSIATGFEYTDIITIQIVPNISQYIRNVTFRYNLRYQVSNIAISNIIFDLSKKTLLSSSFNIFNMSPFIYNVEDNLFSNIPDYKDIIIIPNINILNNINYTPLYYDELDVSGGNTDLSSIYIYDIINNNLSIKKSNGIIYLKHINNNDNKFVRGYIKLNKSDPKIILNIINPYNNTNYIDGKIFLEGLIKNYDGTDYNWNKYFKIYKILIDSTVQEVLSTRNSPIEFKIKLKFYNNENDFINDTSYSEIEYIDLKTITIKSYDDFISSETTYYPRILHIIKKEDVYPEFGSPKNYNSILQFKLKTTDVLLSPLSKVFFDVINITNDIEIGTIETNDYNIMDSVQNFVDSNIIEYTNDKEKILKYINKYILYKASAFPNATELVFQLIVRFRPRYYGLNFSGFNISSFITNEKITYLIPYLYITEYGTLLSIFKNNGIIHNNINLESNFKNILPDYIKNQPIYNYLNKCQQPVLSFGSIQLLNCTNSSKDVLLKLVNNSSGKIHRIDNETNIKIGPYEFKNIKLEETLNINDYTNYNSGIIKIDVTNKTDNHYLDSIEIPIPSPDKYIYQLLSIIDNLNLHGDSKGIETIEFKNRTRYFTNNILINRYNYSLYKNEYISKNVPIMKNKIDINYIVNISNEDYIRCNSTINKFDEISKSGFISIPINLNSLKNTFIEYKFYGSQSKSFNIQNLFEFISVKLSKMHNIPRNISDASAQNHIFNNYLNIFIPGQMYSGTAYIDMFFRRTDVFEWRFNILFDIFINITNPLDTYVLEFLGENNVIIDDIEYIKIKAFLDSIDPESIITNFFLGINTNTTSYLYQKFINKYPNNTYNTIRDECINNDIKIKYNQINISNDQYNSDDILKQLYYGKLYSLIDGITSYYDIYIEEPPYDPEECKEKYLKFKEVQERNNIYTKYILNITHNYPDNLDFDFVPSINNFIYNKIDNNILLNIKLNDYKLNSDGIKFTKKRILQNNSILEIESLYPKIREFSGIINNKLIPKFYNNDLIKYEIGKNLVVMESKFSLKLLKGLNQMETFNFSLNSRNLPRDIVIKKLNNTSETICILGLYVNKLFHGNMSLNNIEIFHNFPFEIISYLKTNDNEIYKQNNNNRIIINKSISRYYSGTEQMGLLYITGIPNQTGEYQIILKTNYTKISSSYSDILEIKVRIVKPEAIDNEYIIIKHERLDSPYKIDKEKIEDIIEGLELWDKYKSYNWSHVRGLCGGGGFHYEDKFQTGEEEE